MWWTAFNPVIPHVCICAGMRVVASLMRPCSSVISARGSDVRVRVITFTLEIRGPEIEWQSSCWVEIHDRQCVACATIAGVLARYDQVVIFTSPSAQACSAGGSGVASRRVVPCCAPFSGFAALLRQRQQPGEPTPKCPLILCPQSGVTELAAGARLFAIAV